MVVVTLNAENMLAIVDLATDKVEKIRVGQGPAQVLFSQMINLSLSRIKGQSNTPPTLYLKLI